MVAKELHVPGQSRVMCEQVTKRTLTGELHAVATDNKTRQPIAQRRHRGPACHRWHQQHGHPRWFDPTLVMLATSKDGLRGSTDGASFS